MAQRLNGVGYGCGSGGQRQGSHAALESGHALFQYILGGVGEVSVDIARVGQAEARRGMSGIVEHIPEAPKEGRRCDAAGEEAPLEQEAHDPGLASVGRRFSALL